jgi:hypothetical protein
MKPTTLQPLEIAADDVDIKLSKPDPAWDKARQLLSAGRQVAIELADEIERLRSQYNIGHGGARRGSSSQVVNLKSGESFVAKLESELGLHPQQAARILESAEYQRRIMQVANSKVGAVIDYVDPKGKAEELYVRDEVKALAEEAVKSWGLPFSSTPARQWAGIMGGAQTRGVDRKDPDHGKILERALRSFANCLEPRYWNRIRPEQRARIETMWDELCENGMIPDTFVESIDRHVKGRK